MAIYGKDLLHFLSSLFAEILIINFRFSLIIMNFEKKGVIIIGNVRHLLHNYKGDVQVFFIIIDFVDL